MEPEIIIIFFICVMLVTLIFDYLHKFGQWFDPEYPFFGVVLIIFAILLIVWYYFGIPINFGILIPKITYINDNIPNYTVMIEWLQKHPKLIAKIRARSFWNSFRRVATKAWEIDRKRRGM